ncbi:hypothetical protein ACWDY7_33615 [Streptomyces calvus]|uniref:Secreted protein n=1 Tax=Streptomyces calvus TaxID=67282 RepID=A0A514JQM8_9ACTN|nr:hypothetical protein [Streptomyces calvus]MBA8948339.1 hypothetical protein [Streptomyces calvus]QDI69292.1 hypothetical protein CD934_11705 [Streptomyces calvus]GGP85353.1 hypothetical protein GCM10010247_68210 [Streptomyces calvus]
MSIRITAKARRGMVALTAVAGLALGVAGCGGGDDDKKPQSSASESKDRGSNPSAQEQEAETPLAELRGTDGLLLQITSAERDAGGFITVNGTVKNDGAESVVVPPQTSGDETEVIKHGPSLGGATLVDSKGKKRYYVLRDTDGRPLTTTGLGNLEAGQTLPVFMQFPAPPADTAEVDLQVPTFSSGTIKISG